jgi:hypothetical protein
MNYIEIIENSEVLAKYVRMEKNWLDENEFMVDISKLDPRLKSIFVEAKESFMENVDSEMRHTSTDQAVRCCEDVDTFSRLILESGIPDNLKIALFKELNVLGYMFDRNRSSYVACHDTLVRFLNTIEKYEASLSQEFIQIWYNSTYFDASSIPFYRGFLLGITSDD